MNSDKCSESSSCLRCMPSCPSSAVRVGLSHLTSPPLTLTNQDRFFRAYTYYEISVVVYEALAVMAFLMLLLTYVGTSSEKQRAALMDKEKQKIPIPFCCIRYRPTKPYFLHALSKQAFSERGPELRLSNRMERPSILFHSPASIHRWHHMSSLQRPLC